MENETPRPIWLRRRGDKVQVLVERNNEWYIVIEEHFDGPFSHIWEDQTRGRKDDL